MRETYMACITNSLYSLFDMRKLWSERGIQNTVFFPQLYTSTFKVAGYDEPTTSDARRNDCDLTPFEYLLLS